MSAQIASIEIKALRSTGESFPVQFSVGAPYRNSESDLEEWRCPVSLQPLYSRLAHAAGADSMQALCMALSLGVDLLGKFVEDGGRLFHPDGTEFLLQSFAFGHAARQAGNAA